MLMIDAHCHLYSDKFDHDRELVIQKARGRLEAVVVSAVDVASLWKSLEIRRKHPDFIHLTAGIHPRHAANLRKPDLDKLWEVILRARKELVALGEVGPDFHHVIDPHGRKRQLMVLEAARRKAEEWNLPLVVHARRAEEAALEVLSGSRTPVLFHCFSGSKELGREICRLGFYVSFSALLLARGELQESAKGLPLEHILTETDSPALSPLPARPRNEPVYVEMVVSRLAKLVQYPPEMIAAITAANARRFYRLPDHSSVPD